MNSRLLFVSIKLTQILFKLILQKCSKYFIFIGLKIR